MDDIYAAADLSTLLSNVSTLLTAFVGVALLYVAYMYAMKAIYYHFTRTGKAEGNFSLVDYNNWRKGE